MGRLSKQKLRLIQEANRRLLDEGEVENDIIKELKEILETWETTEYESDETRWKEYHKDIEELVENHTTEEEGYLDDPGMGGSTPSISHQIANK